MTGNNDNHPTQPKQRFAIIHGHFYQPPRENPWLGVVERQESATPFHDWNERIGDECYRPNAHSRLLDAQGMIRAIHNNYSRMSFNFGPTLFYWLEQHAPKLAAEIIEADRHSCELFDGHGSALAQVFNHIIMPLSSRRDQLTQIRWAKDFFRSRFGRLPEGIWLGETALNAVTVECLIEENIRFVVLSPNQAEQYRKLSPELNNQEWVRCSERPLDSRRPYRVFLPATRERWLDVFFFDEPLSRAVSFENILDDASLLHRRIQGCFEGSPDEYPLVSIATDGETFGHHKPFGDMCLAFYFSELAPQTDIKPVNFGWYLANFPPQYEVTLKNAEGEGTAWSCAHGTGRWIRDCGCSTGGYAHWNQQWRGPLRTALRLLQSRIDEMFQEQMRGYALDPWAVRDAYIPQGLQATTTEQFRRFLQQHGAAPTLGQTELFHIRRMLEAQKFMLFSFTSCGWFFADIAGIETVQNLTYAGRAIQLMGLDGNGNGDILHHVMIELDKAKSNLPDISGRTLFDKYVRPHFRHLQLIGFSAAMDTILSGNTAGTQQIYQYSVQLTEQETRVMRDMTSVRFGVVIENSTTGEHDRYQLLVEHREKTAFAGYLLADEEPYRRSFTRFSPQAWRSEPGVQRLLPGDIFEPLRAGLSRYFQERLEQHSEKIIAQWVESSGALIESMAALNEPPGPFLEAPLRYALSMQFNRTLDRMRRSGNEDAVFTKALAIWNQSGALGFELDKSFARKLLEKLLGAELKRLRTEQAVDSCDRMRYLLNLVDRFKVPVNKSALEDEFYAFIQDTLRPLHDEYKGSSQQNGEQRTRLIQLISFARRMNFNTDAFGLD